MLGVMVLASVASAAAGVFLTHPLRTRDHDLASQAAAQVAAASMGWGMIVSASLILAIATPLALGALALVVVLGLCAWAWQVRRRLAPELGRALGAVGATRLLLVLVDTGWPIRAAALLGGAAALSVALDVHRHHRLGHAAALVCLLADLTVLTQPQWTSLPGAWWPLWLLPMWAVAHGVGTLRAG